MRHAGRKYPYRVESMTQILITPASNRNLAIEHMRKASPHVHAHFDQVESISVDPGNTDNMVELELILLVDSVGEAERLTDVIIDEIMTRAVSPASSEKFFPGSKSLTPA